MEEDGSQTVQKNRTSRERALPTSAPCVCVRGSGSGTRTTHDDGDPADKSVKYDEDASIAADDDDEAERLT